MSTKQNDVFLESIRDEFFGAKTVRARVAIVELLKHEGFREEAGYLSQYVEDGGADTSDELRDRIVFG